MSLESRAEDMSLVMGMDRPANLPLIEGVKWAATAILRENHTLTFASDGCRVTVNYAHYDREAVIVISFAGNNTHTKPSAVFMTSRQYTLDKLGSFYNALCHTKDRDALDLDYFLKIAKSYL